MRELHEYMKKANSKDKKIKHPEYKHGRFRTLYSDLKTFWKKYKETAR